MSDTQPAYRDIARAFAAEGTTACFTLLGDGNMHWGAAMAEQGGVRMVYARHEQCAVAMAMAHARTTGGVGVASVTCGPGTTQICTALSIASRARIPLVIFAGEAPAGVPFHTQALDQAPYIRGTGARYISANSPARLMADVQEAFLTARRDRCPVVIGVPYDQQKRPLPKPVDYVPSHQLIPEVGRMQPDPDFVARAATLAGSGRRIIVVGGRGVLASGARDACIALAEATGALLASTLPARGLFHDSPYDLGVIGGFASALAREKLAEADVVILVGASLAFHASMGGKVFPQARVIQIDTDPRGKNQGTRVADLYLRADARAGVEALTRALAGAAPDPDWRSDEVVRRAAEEYPDGAPVEQQDGLDPRAAGRELDRTLPKDWSIVSGTGHCSFFFTNMRGRPAERWHAIREFGAIGDGISYSVGVATARPGQPIVLIDGDGSLLMHIQELETIRRHGLPILICVFNDGGYGSELHKLRSEGLTEEGAAFGRTDFARLAAGFGIESAAAPRLSDIAPAIEAFAAGTGPMLLDIHISDRVLSPNMRSHTGA